MYYICWCSIMESREIILHWNPNIPTPDVSLLLKEWRNVWFHRLAISKFYWNSHMLSKSWIQTDSAIAGQKASWKLYQDTLQLEPFLFLIFSSPKKKHSKKFLRSQGSSPQRGVEKKNIKTPHFNWTFWNHIEMHWITEIRLEIIFTFSVRSVQA